jgi:uncharacterized protein (TIGR02391 family)
MAGIPKLQMSKDEAEALIKNQIRRGQRVREYDFTSEGIADAEQRLLTWELETDEMLRSMFDTPEIAEGFRRSAGLYSELGETELDKVQNIGGRVTYKIYNLEEVIKQLPEYQPATPTAKPTDIWNMLHPVISGVAKSRFDAGHYADAVETALKHINATVKAKVKKKTGNELDGSKLMQAAFSVNNPVISLDDLSTQSGKDAQVGYMQIFAGAMTGIRNPKAHEIINIDEQRAIHLLFLASLLMYKLDEAV